jgi:hypothetical protein
MKSGFGTGTVQKSIKNSKPDSREEITVLVREIFISILHASSTETPF